MFLNLKKHLEVIENLAQQNINNLYVVLTDLNQWKPGSDIDISFDGNIQEISAKILDLPNVDQIIFTYKHELSAISIIGLYDGFIFYLDFYQDFQRNGRVLIDKNFFKKHSLESKKSYRKLTNFGQTCYHLIKQHEKGKYEITYSDHKLLLSDQNIKVKNIKKLNNKIFYYLNLDLNLKKISYYFLKFKTFLNRKFLIVVMMGPDGTGKSSIINELTEINKLIFRKVQNIHFSPMRLVQNKAKLQNQKPYRIKQPNTKIRSFIKSIWLLIEHIIEICIQYATGRSSNLILIDRSILDIEVDPLRYRFSYTPIFLKILRMLMKKKMLIFVLNGDARIICNRKKELTEKQTARLLEKYSHFSKKYLIKEISTTEKSIDQITSEIQLDIFKEIVIEK